MKKTRRYSEEVRERAVRMVFEHKPKHDWQVGGGPVDRGENWLLGGDAPEVGATS